LNIASVFNFGGYKAYSMLETTMPLDYAVDLTMDKIFDDEGFPEIEGRQDAGKSIFIELVNNLSQILELDPTLSPEIR